MSAREAQVLAEGFGRYQLIKKLATGGMAQLYLARDPRRTGLDDLVVVKRILPHLAEHSEFVTMFLDEARIASRLRHPNVVETFEAGEQGGSYFIAMEYVHGEDVRRVGQQAERVGQRIPIPLACRIISEVCAGLHYAHQKADSSGRPLGIVHRDVSPQNILVTFEGVVKVVDFGIAKAADQASITRSGMLKGKYAYMSPEQAASERLDGRSDVFSAGIVLYELLTGRRLFRRDNDMQTLAAVADCIIPPPSSAGRVVAPALERIVLRALAKDRAARYPDARAFEAELEDWLASHQESSSVAHLGAFMQDIYSGRLAREAAEGRVHTIEAFEVKEDVDPPAPTAVDESGATAEPLPPARPGSRATPQPHVTETETRSLTVGMGSQKPSLSNVSVAQVARVLPPPRPASARHSARAPRDNEVAAGRRLRALTRWGAVKVKRRPVRSAFLLGAAVAVAVGVWVVVLREPGPARILITTQPAGAGVAFGGRQLECRTPCELPLSAPGKYSLVLTKPGHHELQVSVVVPASGNYELPFRLAERVDRR